jgi:hypothetical protein
MRKARRRGTRAAWTTAKVLEKLGVEAATD